MALSVMIVDDDERFLRLVGRILSECGYRPQSEARNILDALYQAARRAPDLALVDIGLPDGNGLDLSKQLTKPPSKIRVVLISADCDATSQRGATEAGALGFIAKSELTCAALDLLLRDG
jgi:two-component system KDP operon response regulator KdpE